MALTILALSDLDYVNDECIYYKMYILFMFTVLMREFAGRQ